MWQAWMYSQSFTLTLATSPNLFLFLVVLENPADKKYSDCDDQDSDDDSRGGSHFFN